MSWLSFGIGAANQPHTHNLKHWICWSHFGSRLKFRPACKAPKTTVIGRFARVQKRRPHCTPQFAHLTANITTRLHCRCNLAIGRFDFNGPAQFRVHLAVCAGNSCRSFLWRKRCRSSTTNSCKRAKGWVWLSIKWIDRIAGQRSCSRTDIFWRARSCTKSRFSNKFLLWLRRQREIVWWFGIFAHCQGAQAANFQQAARVRFKLGLRKERVSCWLPPARLASWVVRKEVVWRGAEVGYWKGPVQ